MMGYMEEDDYACVATRSDKEDTGPWKVVMTDARDVLSSNLKVSEACDLFAETLSKIARERYLDEAATYKP